MSVIQFENITTIYKNHLDALYAYALHMGFDEQTAMDAIHDVFYKLCIRHTDFDDKSNLRFYLFRALRNRLIDIHRSYREIPGLEADKYETEEFPSFQLKITIEDEIILQEDKEEIRKKIEQVLDRLTNRQREIIYLRYIHEYRYEEIAEIMQISVESSRNLLSRTITRLRNSQLPLWVILAFIQQ
ncbi:RNA polymerase sigma factor [Proteiniphilum sp. UBA1028]|jgi:RNA polymerase sigma factor (sigma-70 family)|uniref:RNA polymerase sigma factor n=1 Tax=Proteiniphilum sp. UBA1028 TaxID=1947251 RepID=UPI000E9311EC|nr:sigma-70 family RNA polymerase sigma factor [Proteiniphilum sp. UBA1028]HBG57967.1 sigma-70 family RNA polymerase sigma factor [Porphyromonadaceae bacterium]